jgi:hypothetical protein
MNDEIKQKWNICLEEERRIAETTAIPIGYDLIEQAAKSRIAKEKQITCYAIRTYKRFQ